MPPQVTVVSLLGFLYFSLIVAH